MLLFSIACFFILENNEYSSIIDYNYTNWGAVLVARRIRNRSVVDLKPIKGSRCVLVQETLPSLLSTGWFQEQIRAWFHKQQKYPCTLWKID